MSKWQPNFCTKFCATKHTHTHTHTQKKDSYFINNNNSINNGGVISCGGAYNVISIQRSKIINNTAIYHGGVFYGESNALQIFESIIINNQAIYGNGGAIFMKYQSFTNQQILIQKVLFTNNRAINGNGTLIHCVLVFCL